MEKDFEKTMENLETPQTEFVKHQEVLKIGLMNVRKSARIGILFILLPVVLVILAYIKVVLLMKSDFFSNFVQFVGKDNQLNYSTWLLHIFLIMLPILAIIINLLAITHFYVNKANKELIITFQYRLKNLVVLILGAAIILAVFLYIIFLN
jgi:hypothetical protein